ncbi:unnamed protein product [Spirodela intermedia]|uniref:Poly(A) RNA polymerase mitochondrial-like central palm domain-containing protein n=1 Tax=Spirodela intermedia TaxID=51605 RepID=A0A7I8IDV9_SPIIN|nr:unnamed protein product [Spirodela intermedia]CAA6655031.1 unnamed protein product [Spirodela intermedia]
MAMDYGQTSNANEPLYGLLESTLDDILSLIKPAEEDQVRRLNTVKDIRTAIQSVSSLQGTAVIPFGSYVSDLYTKWGDLDISIQLSHNPSSWLNSTGMLSLVMSFGVLEDWGLGHVKYIPQARVPLLVFKSRLRNISCDISIDNHVGEVKSKILLSIAKIDGRFRDMVLLSCNFPPLKNIYGGNLLEDFAEVEDLCVANIASLGPKRGENMSTLRELLISFFWKFSKLKELAEDYAICPYSGRCEPIENKPQWRVKPYKLIVEDPFEVPDNAARAVSVPGLAFISRAFADTFRKLSSTEVLSDKRALLGSFLRPHALVHAGVPPLENRAAEASRGGRRPAAWFPSSRQSAAPGGASEAGDWRGTSYQPWHLGFLRFSRFPGRWTMAPLGPIIS